MKNVNQCVLLSTMVLLLWGANLSAQAPDSTWPMFMHDPYHTGFSPLAGDMDTCYILWSYATGYSILSSPALADIEEDGMLEVVVGCFDWKVYAFNGEDGSQLWTYTTGDAIYSSPALGDIDGDGKLEVVFGSDDFYNNTTVYALNGENGSLRWSYATGDNVYSSPVLGDIDKDGMLEVVVGSSDDNVYALNGEDGSFLWSYTTGARVLSSPALADIDGDDTLEVVVGSEDSTLYALNGQNGSLLWSYKTGRSVTSSPSLGDIDSDGNIEVVIGDYSNIYALNGLNGSFIWSYASGASSAALGDIDGDDSLEVVCGDLGNSAYALNGENGSFIWSYTTGGNVASSPALADIDGDGSLEVVIGSSDGNVYALNGADGGFIWSYTTNGGVFSSPALADIDDDGDLEVVISTYAGGSDDNIHALNGEDVIPPLPFSLISPIDSAILTIVRPTFMWESSSDAQSGLANYEVYINDTLRHIGLDTSWTADYDLSQAWHTWYVVAYDSVGNPRQSNEVWSMAIDTTAPSTVTLILPSDSAYVGNSTVSFIWHQSTDNLSGIDYYVHQYALDNGFSSGMVETTLVDTMATKVLSDTLYYWRVKAVDRAANESEWSSVWQFEVDTDAPGMPILIAPVGGIYLNSDTVAFEWSAVQSLLRDLKKGEGRFSPIRYVLQVDTSGSFMNPLVVDTVTMPYDTVILGEEFYVWRVKAYDLAGNESQYSGVEHFGVDMTAPVIESTTVWSDTSWAGPFQIFAKVTDALAGVDSVVLYYQRDEDPGWVSEVMTLTGTPDWYRRVVPPVSNPDDSVRYYVEAVDMAEPGNVATDPAGAPGDYYGFIANWTGIMEHHNIPKVFSFGLRSNPSRGRAVFNLAVPENAEITLRIYDVIGRLIDTPIAGMRSAGFYAIPWSTRASAGIYFYALDSPWQKRIGKLVLLR